MRKLLILISFTTFFTGLQQLHAQQANEENDSISNIFLVEKQWTLGLMLHTNGWGIKFRKGKNVTFLKQLLWEVEFSTYKSPKEVRSVNPYFSDAKSYIYGKLNVVSFLRGGIGFQHILNRKPFWGGVQLSALYYGGFSLGIAKPVYLNIIKLKPNNDYIIEEERYNPDIHSVDNIYGRGSFLNGFNQLGLHPGIYVKSGLEFEFGTKNIRINSLEAGATLDFSPIPIAIMAYNPKQNFFVTLYLSISLGKRYN